MTTLKNAPLMYTLGMIQFPKVPGMREDSSIHFLIKSAMNILLPTKPKIPVFSTNFCPQGMQIEQDEKKLWQFMSIDRKWGFILTEQSICLHTVDYHDFLNFSNCMQKGLETLLKIPEIGIDWMIGMGIRYVNLVVTKDNHSLKDYLDSWVLPIDPPQSQLSIIEGSYIARYNTGIGELRLQSKRNPKYTFPSDLQSLLIVKNEWAQCRPETDFALIDIDHSISFPQPERIKTKEILKNLKELHKISKEVFISVGTKFSHEVWR